MTTIRRNRLLAYLPLLFWLGVALITVLALIPGPSVPHALRFWDKAQHALAFAALALTGGLAFPCHVRHVFIGLMAHGALIEITQSTLTSTRFGDPVDWFADCIGVVFGLAVCVAWRRCDERRNWG